MRLSSLYLKDFRCFSERTFSLDYPIVLFEGVNGSGKTTLLEALHYLCYLRSFRTHLPTDLVRFGQQGFFIKATVHTETDEANDVQVGFSGKKRLVKINTTAVASYKELMAHYRVITLTEDDLDLIKAGPEQRRLFIDQALALIDPSHMNLLRTLRHIVDSRNALLEQVSTHRDPGLAVWTEQLFTISLSIYLQRYQLLTDLVAQANDLLTRHIDEHLQLTVEYRARSCDYALSCAQFMEALANNRLGEQEHRYRRSLFGAHLDDFSLTLQGKGAKHFASRGQQKLVVLLLKLAQALSLREKRGASIFLLDDFMTDFDERRAQALITPLVHVGGQLIFTSPITGGALGTFLQEQGGKSLLLTV